MLPCSGYLPPEYIESNLISNKFDMFSLGVVMIKIIAGRCGRSKSAQMPPQEFINLVRNDMIFTLTNSHLLWNYFSHLCGISLSLTSDFIGRRKLENKVTDNTECFCSRCILSTSYDMH